MDLLLVEHQVVTDFVLGFFLLLRFGVTFAVHLRLLGLDGFAHADVTFLHKGLSAHLSVDLLALGDFAREIVNHCADLC